MAEPQNHINLHELNHALSQNVIHYDPTRVDFTINEFELSQLEEIGKSMWKEIFFVSLGITIPTILNGIVAQNKLDHGKPLTTEIFINYLIGALGLILSIISLCIMRSISKKKNDIIKKIKEKPRFVLPQ